MWDQWAHRLVHVFCFFVLAELPPRNFPVRVVGRNGKHAVDPICLRFCFLYVHLVIKVGKSIYVGLRLSSARASAIG